MSELGKPFLKKSDEKKNKKKKNRKSMSKCCYGEQKTTSEICNFDSNKKLGPE